LSILDKAFVDAQEYFNQNYKTQRQSFWQFHVLISNKSELLLKQAVKDGIIRANPAEHVTVCPRW
jgi:hypothetical protein